MTLGVRPPGLLANALVRTWRRERDRSQPAAAPADDVVVVSADHVQIGVVDESTRDADQAVRYGLRVTAGYAWRIVIVLAFVYILAV
jgi:hypothetical protein